MDIIRQVKRLFITPAGVTFLFLVVVNLILLSSVNWDPLAMIRIGTRFSQGDPNGTEGYDGQFVYYIARDLTPSIVAPHLDDPPYRYQRILLSLLVRLLTLGYLQAFPWAMIVLGIISQTLGTWVVSELLSKWGIKPWYALTYGLWVGFLLCVQLGLPEPLAYGLAAGGIMASDKGHRKLGWLLYGLAIFAKETTVLFLAAQLLSDLLRRQWKSVLGLGMVGVFPWIIFQGWLWLTFGRPGLGIGGNTASPFEILPYMGLWRIGGYSLGLLLTWTIIFGPTVVLPSAWGILASVRKLITRDFHITTIGLFLNGLMIITAPFAVFREPLGLLRYAGGFVLGGLLFASKYHQTRALNILSILWLAMNAFFVKLFIPGS